MRTIKNSIIIILCMLATSTLCIKAQKQITIENANVLKQDVALYGKDVIVLIGDVKSKHKDAVMYCDTAYQYEAENRIMCIGNVHMIKNDTLHLYGDRLNYNGNSGIAEVRQNVKLVNKDVVLTTNYLDYNRNDNVAYYFNFGKVVNKDNTLTSKKGYYYPQTEDVFYKDSVVALNPKYTMFSDTLKYNSISKIANIEGPTFIVSDNNIIYAELGYYDTVLDEALLKKNAYVQGEQLLKGDTIFYNRNTGIGKVYNNMELHDTTNNMIITGNYGYYNELTQDALTTKKAVLMQVYNNDTLFLHADTLEAVPLDDGENKLVKAYRQVQYFRTDMQGRCDSMVFDSRDTTNTFFYDPIMWSTGNQLTADVIKMYTKDEVLDKVDLNNRSFIITEQDSGKYNQIKGKKMIGYIKNNEIYKIDVNGNAQSIYYPMEEEGAIGVNKAQCSNMVIYLKQKQVSRIKMQVSPKGKLSPVILVPEEDQRLDGFYWLDEFRPKSKDEIFIWKELPTMERGEDRSEYDLDETYIEN